MQVLFFSLATNQTNMMNNLRIHHESKTFFIPSLFFFYTLGTRGDWCTHAASCSRPGSVSLTRVYLSPLPTTPVWDPALEQRLAPLSVQVNRQWKPEQTGGYRRETGLLGKHQPDHLWTDKKK